MRKRDLFFLTCLASSTAVWAQAPDLRRMDIVERSVPAGPVALVNGTAVEGREFLREYRRHLRNVMHMVDMPEVTDEFRVHTGLTILGEMIRTEILLQEARKRNLSVADAEVDGAYQEKLRHFEQMLGEEIGATPTETQVLERAGQTREQAKASIRDQLLADKAADQIASDKGVSLAEAEIRAYYDSNPQLFQRPGRLHLNQILVIPKPNATRADANAWKRAEEQAERARARILAGEQFAAVARDMSEAPDASAGGDLGMLPAEELPPFFVEMASMMKPGAISGVFRSEFGCHVMRLVETDVAEAVPTEDAFPAIRRMLLHLKTEEAVLAFCEPIVNDPDRTKIFIQLERTLAAQGG